MSNNTYTKSNNTYADMVDAARKSYKQGMKPIVPMPRPSSRTAPNVAALTAPQLTPDALTNPTRARAEAEGYALFGKRTWFLVERGGAYRAVETMEDAPRSFGASPGWSLVGEMKR